MKQFFSFLLSCGLTFNACTSDNSSNTAILETKDTIHPQPNDSTLPTEEEGMSENELNYVVSIAEGYNYDSLRVIAVQAAEHLKIGFDTMDRYYSVKRKKIVLPDNYEDDMYAGEYFFRRIADPFVSIEMRSFYIDTLLEKDEKASEGFYADSLRMFVFAGMSPNKATADSLLKVLKGKYKKAYVFPSDIFMGCMH